MGSHAQDAGTQTAASSGAQGSDQTLNAIAKQNQGFTNNTRQAQFGTYNPSTNSYSGGTVSQFLNPNNLNPNNLSGSFQAAYNQSKNQNAQGANNAVQTTEQNMASRGMGKSPAGFGANQEREAYQTAANNNGQTFSNLLTRQQQQALNNYWSANNLLNSNASQTANLSVQGNQAAAGNYASLYGTASQQTQSPLGSILGAAAGVGGAAITKYCWIAAELYDGWDDPRTDLVRNWLSEHFSTSKIGGMIVKLYARFGERVAEIIKTNRPLRAVMRRVFNAALFRAVNTVEAAL